MLLSMRFSLWVELMGFSDGTWEVRGLYCPRVCGDQVDFDVLVIDFN